MNTREACVIYFCNHTDYDILFFELPYLRKGLEEDGINVVACR